MSSVAETWINAYLRRLWLGEFLQWAAQVCAAFCIVFGLCVLSVKLFLPGLWPGVLWLMLGLLPAAGIAWRMTVRHRWTRHEAVARLDQALQARGLLMMIEESDSLDLTNNAWKQDLEANSSQWRSVMPRIRPRRFLSHLALPLIFAVAVCFVPLRSVAQTSFFRKSLAQKTTRELADLVEKMQQQNLLDDPQEELRVQSEIQKLAEETRYKPLNHEQWEAVDALQERLSLRINAANTAMSKAVNAATHLKAANDAAEMLTAGDDAAAIEASQKQIDDAIEALEKSLSSPGTLSAKKGKLTKLRQSGSKGAKETTRKGLSEEELEELNDLKDFLNQEQKKLSELKGQCQGKCQGGGECDGDSDVSDEIIPGSGSINRGRADAEMTWGHEKDANGFKFKEVVLPEGSGDSPNEDIVRIERMAPTVEPAESASRGAARQMDASTGVSTWNRKLSPRHRNIVQKYFDGR